MSNSRVARLSCGLLLSLFPFWLAFGADYFRIETIAGQPQPNNVPPTNSFLKAPEGIAFGPDGNLNIVEVDGQTVRRIVAGNIVTVAGNGLGTSATLLAGGPAANAVNTTLSQARYVAFDGSGNMFVTDSGTCTVDKVDAITNKLTVYAGTAGQCGYTGDNGPAASAKLSTNIRGIAVDSTGILYILDSGNFAVRKVDTSQQITTFAGNGTGTYTNNVLATSTGGIGGSSLAVDPANNLYIGNGSRILQVNTTTNIVKILAGGTGSTAYNGDGHAPLSTNLGNIRGMKFDSAGNLYFTDNLNLRVLRLDAAGTAVTTVAGNGSSGYSGDGVAAGALNAAFEDVEGVEVDSSLNVYVADFIASVVRKIAPGTSGAAGTITTFAGSPGPDNVAPTAAFLNLPADVAVDAASDVFISDYSGRIRKANSSLTNISTFGGQGFNGEAGDGGQAISALLDNPNILAFDAPRNILYLYDSLAFRVRKIDASGNISTVAGGGASAASDGVSAISASLGVGGIAVDSNGVLYVSDYQTNKIWSVTSGNLQTYAGTGGTAGASPSPDGTVATAALLNVPYYLKFDSGNNLYFIEQGYSLIRRILASDHSIHTIAGNGTSGYTGDGLAATSAEITPNGMAVAANGDVYISQGNEIRLVTAASGTIETIAGSTAGFSGDGGPAASAQLNFPGGLAIDANGRVLIADSSNNDVRRLTRQYQLTTSANPSAGGTITGAGVYDAGSVIQVTANPASGYTFTGFSDGAAGTSSPVSVAMNGPVNVVANFAPTNPPVVNSIVNGADSSAPPLAPGSFASIYGTNLAASAVATSTAPLQTTLGNSTVSVNGRLSPIQSVSPNQINFQIPYETATGSAAVVVNNNGTPSSAFQFQVTATAPGFLANPGVQNQNGSANSSANPAVSESTITAYFTGSGQVNPPVADGAGAPGSPFAVPVANFSATIGGRTAQVNFFALAPGFVGITQVNIQVPPLGTGSYPVVVTIGGVSCQAGTVYVTAATGLPLAIASGPGYGSWSVGDVQNSLVATGGTPPYTWSISGGSLPAGVYIRTDTPSFFPGNASAGIIGVATAPTPPGGANFTVKVTDSASNSVTQAANLTVTGLTITDPYQMPDGFTNVNYSWTLNAQGATGGVTWSVANGFSLPPGLTLTGNVISGTPTAAGFYNNFGIIAADSTGSVFHNYSVSIYGPGFVTDSALGNLVLGAPITSPIQITGQGGTPPYTFSSPNLFAGLSISSSGAITGTPTCCEGSYFFNVNITDNTGLSYNKQFVFNFLSPSGDGGVPQLNVPVAVSDATIGEPQTYGNFNVNGGKQPYTWSATGLPNGMRLLTSSLYPQFGTSAQIAGAVLAAGTYSVVVSVTDSSSHPVTVQRTFTFNVKTMDAEYPPNPTFGTPYSYYLRPIGGTAPFTWALVGGALPSGLSLNTSTGVISGTPLENGNFGATFTITSSAASGSLQITRSVGFNVNSQTSPVIQINNSSPLPDTLVNAPYNFQLNGCCTAGGIVWSVSNGSLPSGLSLNPSTGLISGTPTAAQGVVTFTIQATDGANSGNFGRRVFTINVSPLALSIPTPYGIVNTPYPPQTFTASGGTSPYMWALAPNSQPLPAGITLSAGGVLSGTPTTEGGFGFSFVVTDSAVPAHTFTGFAFVSIYTPSGPPLVINSGPFYGTWSVGDVQSNLAVTGGIPPYTWSITSGSLPAGLYIRTDTPNFFPANASAGIIGVATATTPGGANFTLKVTDSVNNTITQAANITITGLTIEDPYQLPDGFTNANYSWRLNAGGATGGVTWNVANGNSLPPGLSLNGGIISGSPSANGFYNFGLTATDSTGSVYHGYNLAIYGPGFVTDSALGNLTLGTAITTPIQITGQGGTPPYTFSSPNLFSGLSISAGGAITGTPTCCQGSYFFNINITDHAGLSYNKQFIFNFLGSNGDGGLPQLNMPLPASDATVGEFETYGNFNVYGGKQPYTWSATGLPIGMVLVTSSLYPQLSTAALIGGAPLATGTYSAIVSVKDSSSPAVTVQRTFTFNVKTMDSDYPPNPTAGSAYSFYLRPIGGTAPFTWAMVGGALPQGLTLNTSTGVISGTPLENGNFGATFTITSSPASGSLQITRSIGFNVNSPTSPQLQINNSSPLPDAQVNLPYNFQLNACCAAGSVTWTGSLLYPLPAGLSLGFGTGLISGTPTAAQGPVTFEIIAHDSGSANNSGSHFFTINVSPITTNTPTPYGNVGMPYSTTFTASGGSGSYTWALASNSQPLPSGVTLSAGGVLSGIPTTPGGFGFSYIVTDTAQPTNNTFTGFAFVNIYTSGGGPPLGITTNGALGTSPIGQSSITLNAAGGSGNYTWSLASGSLPPGLNIAQNPFGPSGQTALVGIATTPGNYAFNLTVNDGNTSVTQPFTMRITGLTVKDINLPDAFVSVPFSYPFTALNPGGGVTFTSTSTLPNGLTLSPAGALSGTPTSPGSYNINFSVFDGVDTVYRGLQLVVYAVDLTTPGALPNATQGVAYAPPSLAASGGMPGAPGYQYAVTGGSLPPGLTLSSSGAFSGTTNGGTGIYWFYVTVTDAASNSYQKTMSIDVVGGTVAQIQINLGPFTDAVAGNGFGLQIPACCGGTAPFTWTATGLPPGMSIRSGSGVTSDYVAPGWGEIWGVASTPGTYNVTVTVTDHLGASSSLAFPLHVSVLNLAPCCGLPNGTINTPYSQISQIIGGSGPYGVGQVNGFLPDGLTLSTPAQAPGNFAVTGTPLENGFFCPVGFQVTDGAGNTLTLNDCFNINNVSGGITINNGSNLGTVTTGGNLSVQLSACCATGYVWSAAPGSLPSGLTLSSSGLLSGTVNAAGLSTFLVEAADATGAVAPGYRQFVLNSTPISITTNSLPFGNVNSPYNQSLTATDGTATLNWIVAYGNYLPPGLSLGLNGTLSGTPSAAGQYGFSVLAADQNGHFATAFYVLNILPPGQSPAPTFATGPNLGTANVGTVWIALGANSGTGSYTWNLVSGTLPPGLALRSDVPSFFGSNQQAGLIGVATTPGSYGFTLSVTSGGKTSTQAFTLRISALNLQDITPPDAFVGTAFTYTFNPIAYAGNASNVTFTVNGNSTNGVMPPGLSLSSSGQLTGTPTTAGSYVIAMNVSDGVDTVYEQYNLNIYAVDITTDGLLPNGTQYGVYAATNLAASGGSGGYVWTANCCLPQGLSLSSGGTISGTVTGGPGLYQFVITATDSNSVSYSKYMTIDVVGSPITPMRITNLTFNDPVLGNRYGAVQSVCCGGTAPFTWTVTGLPPGLTYEPNTNSFQQYPSAPGGVQIYGVPQQTGIYTYNVTYAVTDSTGATTSLTVPMHVSVLDLNLPGTYSAYNLPNGTIGIPYTSTFRVLGGSGPYSFSQAQPELPDGLTIPSASSLTVSGTPLENGGFGPGFTFSDSGGNTLFRYEGIQIGGGASTIGVNNNGFDGYNLGTVPVGVFYSTQFSACCAPSYTWSPGSTLPTGLSVSPSGQLSGTPTVPGTYTFLIDAADPSNPSNVGVKSFVLTVTPISITTSLPYGDVGVPYGNGSGSVPLTATGGTGALTWTQTFTNGSQLPPGLTLNPSGSITGTPTSAGAYNVILQASDTDGHIAIRSYTIDIYQSGPPPLNLPLGPNLGPYAPGPNQLQIQLSATGGTPPYHYSITPGTPPVVGLRVQDGQPLPNSFPSSVTGGLLGLLGPGSYSTSVRVTDSMGLIFDRAINITVLPIDIVNSPTLPRAVRNTPYTFQLTPYGGSGNYVWGSSNPPAGLSLNSSTGVLSGTPTSTGTFNFSVSLADVAGGGSISRSETLVVSPFAITDSPVLPQATANAQYGYQLHAPNCGANCSWTVYNSSLPGGLSLSSGGFLSGTFNAATGTQSSFYIQASGPGGTTQKRFTLTILPTVIQALSIAGNIGQTSLPLGVSYATPLVAFGGTPPYAFSLVSGSVPPGMSVLGPGETIGDLQPGYTYFVGWPEVAGTYHFTLQVTDNANNTASRAYTVAVSTMALLYSSLPNTLNPLIYNTPYSQQMLVVGGTGNYTSWTTSSSPVYPGLSVNSTTGLITGSPTNTGPASTLWTVTDDAGNTLTNNVSISAASSSTATIQVLNGPAPGTVIQTVDFYSLFPFGGTGPYTISAVSPLPAGVFLVPGSPGFNDTLEINAESAGTLTFTIQATDANGLTGAQTYSVIVPDFFNTVPGSLPNGSVGVPYSQSLFAFGGGPVTWALPTGSALPPGLSLSADGLISGTPTAAANYSFIVTLTDASGSQSSTTTISISPLAITSPATLPVAVVGTIYTAAAPLATLTAAGGAGLTWSATGLPGGMSITPSGLIIGTPGTPVNAAQFNVTFTVTDGVSPLSYVVPLFVRQPNPTELDYPITSTKLPDAVLGFVYSQLLLPDGGLPPYSWSVANGSVLPPGLNLTVSGTDSPDLGVAPGTTDLLGKPTAAGPYTFSLIATDSAGTHVTRTFTLNVTPLSLSFLGIPPAVIGTPYSQQIIVSGGVPSYMFSVSPVSPSGDTLPPGLMMSSSGLITGTPTSTGSYSFNLTVTDMAGNSLTQSANLPSTAQSGLYVNTGDFYGAYVGRGFTATLTTGGGSSTYTWSVSSGSLPLGVTLTPAGVLQGAVAVPGTYTFTLRATDNANASNFAEHVYTVVVSSMQLLTPGQASPTSLGLPSGQAGSPYSYQLGVAGGTGPYTFTESPFYPLPPGMNLSSTGLLFGTPQQTGVFNVAPIVTDSAGVANKLIDATPIPLVIAPVAQPAPLITSPSAGLSDSSVGVPYLVQLDQFVSGGTPPYTWTDPSATLPAGLAVYPGANGVSSFIAGIPTAPGSSPVSLHVSDANGQSLTVSPLGTLNVSPLALTPDTIPAGNVGTPYSVSLVPSGGTAPYSLMTQPNSDMPGGLTLNGAGVLSGTPTSPGRFVILVSLQDHAGNTLHKNYEITIDNAAGQSPAISIAPKPVNVYYVVGGASPIVPLSVSATSGNPAFAADFNGIAGSSLSAAGGTSPATINLNLNAASLAQGTYFGVAAVASSSTVNQWDAVPVVLTVAAPQPCTYSLNPSSTTIGATGGTGSFSISTGPLCAWSATASDPSVKITSSASGAGNATVNFSVPLNATSGQINSTITVAGQIYSISQFALLAGCSFGISPPIVNTTSVGGTAQIRINASNPSCAWTATGLGASPANGTGSSQVTVTIPVKATTGAQVLNATVAGQTLTVNQGGADCTVSLNSTSASILSSGGTGSVTVTTPDGCAYNTVLGPSWISVTSGASGTGSGTLTYSVDPNSTTVSRSGSITIGGVTFTITEQALPCSLTLDTSTLGSPFASAGGVGTIGITANGPNCSWTASTGASWAIVSPPGGTGSGTVSVSTKAANAAPAALSGSVTIAGQSIGISQAGVTCAYSLRSSSGTVPASGGSGSVGVVAATGCSWTSVSNDSTWLTITSSGSGGTTDVQFVAQPNPSALPRVGTLTIAGLTYTVTEAGAPCSFSLMQPGVTVASGGATNQVLSFTAATGGCSVTPVSYANWLHVVGSSLVGVSGTLTYSADANPAGSTRMGSIQVGDQLFTVTQTGSACAFSLNSYGAAFGELGGGASFLGSPSAQGCAPDTGVDQPSIVTLGTLNGPLNDIFTQPYSVSVFSSATNAIRKATITFGGQIFTIKQTSW